MKQEAREIQKKELEGKKQEREQQGENTRRFQKQELNTRAGKVNVGLAQLPESIMSGNKQGILIVLVTVKTCQVFKALTRRTGLARNL